MLLICSLTATAQYERLDLMPKQKRDSLLIKIAKEGILNYSDGYLRERDKPIIRDLGINNPEDELYSRSYKDIRLYSVAYPINKAEKELYKNKDYCAKVVIRADNGRMAVMNYFDYDLTVSGLDRDINLNRKVEYKDKIKYPDLEKLKEAHRPLPPIVFDDYNGPTIDSVIRAVKMEWDSTQKARNKRLESTPKKSK